MTKLTPLQKRLRRKYTRRLRSGMRSYNALLEVDVQSFFVCENRNKTQAEWFRDMLAIALSKIIIKERWE